jgi:hypothetical protein
MVNLTNGVYAICIIIAVFAIGSLIVTANTPTEIPTKEYWIFEHDIDPLRVYTNQGIFLFQTENEWNALELNHTYSCEETYSNISLANCIEIVKE